LFGKKKKGWKKRSAVAPWEKAKAGAKGNWGTLRGGNTKKCGAWPSLMEERAAKQASMLAIRRGRPGRRFGRRSSMEKKKLPWGEKKGQTGGDGKKDLWGRGVSLRGRITMALGKEKPTASGKIVFPTEKEGEKKGRIRGGKDGFGRKSAEGGGKARKGEKGLP